VEVLEAMPGGRGGPLCMYLVSPLMIHGELSDAVFNITMSEQAARMIIVQIASALAHLHLLHMVTHRDLKPQNCLCHSEDPTLLGCVKLADFGLCARFTQRRGREFDAVCGTMDYFAPEIAQLFSAQQAGRTTRRYGAAVDVWALGCIAFELIHGQPPFVDAGGDEAILEAIARGAIDLPEASFSAISADGTAFIKYLLEPDPDRRPLIEDCFEHAWLLPVHDASLRVQMTRPVREEALERRVVRTPAKVRGSPALAPAPGKPPRKMIRSASDKVLEAGTDPMVHYSPLYTPAKSRHGGAGVVRGL
jgi:serine/threonine protein kinase